MLRGCVGCWVEVVVGGGGGGGGGAAGGAGSDEVGARIQDELRGVIVLLDAIVPKEEWEDARTRIIAKEPEMAALFGLA